MEISEPLEAVRSDPVWLSFLPLSLNTLALTCDLPVFCTHWDGKDFGSPLSRTFEQCTAHLSHLKQLQSLTCYLSGPITSKSLLFLSPLPIRELTLGHARATPLVTLEESSHVCAALSKCVFLRTLKLQDADDGTPYSSIPLCSSRFIETMNRVRSALGTRFHASRVDQPGPLRRRFSVVSEFSSQFAIGYPCGIDVTVRFCISIHGRAGQS